MNWRTSIKSLLISSITLFLSPVAAQAIPIEEIEEIAEEVTVKIELDAIPDTGTGVIISQQDNTYYVLTAQHVVKEGNIDPQSTSKFSKDGYVTSHDEKKHLITEVLRFPNQIDLAVVKFEAETDYSVATVSNYQYQFYKNRNYNNYNSGNNDISLKEEQRYVFVSGYPKEDADTNIGRIFNPGLLEDESGSAFSNPEIINPEDSFIGYEIAYTNLTRKGVSGGPVLDSSGRLVGIHGRADAKRIDENNEIIQEYINEYIDKTGSTNVRVGLSAGIPIKTFLDWYEQEQHNWNLKVESTSPDQITGSQLNQLKQWEPKIPIDNKDNIFYWLMLGNNKWRLNQTQEAIEAFDRAIKLEENWFFPWFIKGFALGFDGQYEQAAKACSEAARLARNDYNAQRCKAGAKHELGDFEAASTAINRAIDINPNNYADHAIKGELLFALGQPSGALETFTKAIKLREELGLPPSANLLNNKGFVMMSQNNYNQALNLVEQALNINENYASAWSNKGFILRELEQHKKALDAYHRATELAPNNPTIWNNKGLTLFEMEQYEEALQAFEQALAIDEDFQQAKENRNVVQEMLP